MTDVSTTMRAAMNAPETSEAFLVLIELSHDDLADTIRVTSDGQNTESNGNTYISYPFDIYLPYSPETGVCKGKLTIDNVDRQIVENLRQISTAPTIRIMVVLASDPDTIEIDYPNFELGNAEYDAMFVTGDLTLPSYSREPYPADTMNPSTFPGIF